MQPHSMGFLEELVQQAASAVLSVLSDFSDRFFLCEKRESWRFWETSFPYAR